MKNLLFLLLLISVGISCEQDTFLDEEEDSTIELRNHQWTMSEIATIDSVMYVFFKKDTSELITLIDKVEERTESGYYENVDEVLNEIGLDKELFERFIHLPIDEIIVDRENQILSSDFQSKFQQYVERDLSLVYFIDNGGLIQLRSDPCSFSSTAWLVGWSAVRLAVGGGSVAGAAVAVVSVGMDIYDYASECG